jgi:hypothetical protein
MGGSAGSRRAYNLNIAPSVNVKGVEVVEANKKKILIDAAAAFKKKTDEPKATLVAVRSAVDGQPIRA